MNTALRPDEQRLWQIFHPYAAAKEAEIRPNDRFVYYTSADVATQIIRKREIWMRKSSCMNDFSEVRHGWECLAAAWNAGGGSKLRGLLDSHFPGVFAEIEKDFNRADRSLVFNTYLTCVSEHRDTENELGRLSMWRAYGGNAGVALVMNNSAFLDPNYYLKAYASPVAYCDTTKFAEQFGNVLDNIETEIDFLKEKGPDLVKAYLFRMLAFAAACTKHPGFAEEVEWRVIHWPWWEKSDHLVRGIEVINGVAQPVYKIPLTNVPGKLVGLEIPELLDHIIIGPTRNPQPSWEAFKDLLAEAGVAEPHKRVSLSNIPLRQ